MTPHAVARSPKGKAAAAGEHRLSSFVALHHIHVDELLHADGHTLALAHSLWLTSTTSTRAHAHMRAERETEKETYREREREGGGERETERKKEKKERDTARDTETDTETDTDSQRDDVQKHQVPCAHVPTS